MPEYLPPGVYVEEVSVRAKSIEGVTTSITGFVGPTRYGLTGGESELLTSFSDFERIYGGIDQLQFNGSSQDNYVAHAVRAFFDNGGRRLYVSRIYEQSDPTEEHDGKATGGPSPPSQGLRARFPGLAGNMRITFAVEVTPNLLVKDPEDPTQVTVSGVRERDVVFIKEGLTGSPAEAPSPSRDGLYDVVTDKGDLAFRSAAGSDVSLGDLQLNQHRVHLVTVTVRSRLPGRFTEEEVWEGFSPHPSNRKALTAYFTDKPSTRRLHLTVPFSILPGNKTSGAELAEWLLGGSVVDALSRNLYRDDEIDHLKTSPSTLDFERPRPTELETSYTLTKGSDGELPNPTTYKGHDTGLEKTGLEIFVDVEEISIVAAPGYSANYQADPRRAHQIAQHLISHCERMHYRIAVLDPPDNQLVSGVLDFRGRFDSNHAAVYYPWVTVLDPLDPDGHQEINLPPSGFVAGIYARNDIERGVHKAPANEVVRGVIGLEVLLNKAQQEVLNPEGVNCFRFFEGRGCRLWGARTISSDSEWKYVNVRRYLAYLERSIELGTQWVVFENSNEALWTKVAVTVEDFLFNEWKPGRLMGTKPEEAYFVQCDRSTMTQNDIDNGRLICLIGVAPVRPAEFVIFRIGQWTADRRT